MMMLDGSGTAEPVMVIWPLTIVKSRLFPSVSESEVPA